MENYYQNLLANNKKWVVQKLSEDPDFFNKLAEGQKPPVLWIGCSDSRVPANEIIGAPPGEVFVHRNIANMVVHSDMNLLSVLDYAVNVLEVNHIIVCTRVNRYVELNVFEQVCNLAKTSIVQGAWERKSDLHLHGWVYDVADGLIKDLEVTLKDNSSLQSVYKLDI